MGSAGLGDSDNVSQLYNVSSLNQCRELIDFTIIYSMFSFCLNLNKLLSSTYSIPGCSYRNIILKKKKSAFISEFKNLLIYIYTSNNIVIIHVALYLVPDWMIL